MFVPIIGTKVANKIEEASKLIGETVQSFDLDVQECTTMFVVYAVRCARLANADKEGFMRYVSDMWDQKSELPTKNRFLL